MSHVQGALAEAAVIAGMNRNGEVVCMAACAPSCSPRSSNWAVSAAYAHAHVQGALAEAAVMMGMERNGEVVRMAAYAPLLVNERDHWYWTNLIAFNATQ